MEGKQFKDKVSQHVYRIKKSRDWMVFMENEDNGHEILTSVRILKTFYEEVKQ
jgi:hypothetical protein